jgi:hypothetical protein
VPTACLAYAEDQKAEQSENRGMLNDTKANGARSGSG